MEARRHPFHWIGLYKDWRLFPRILPDALVSLPPADLATHALVIAATGSGKTNLLHHLIAQDILLGNSFGVIDARGDLVAAVLELLADRIDPHLVALFDLRDREHPLGFNPLFGAGEPYFRALSVVDAVEAQSESWGVKLSETLRNAALLLAATNEPLTRIEDLFYNESFRVNVLKRVDDDSVRGFWERYGELSRDRQADWAGPVLNKVSLLLSPASLRKSLGSTSPLDLGRHLNRRGSVVLVSLAVDEVHSAGRKFGSLMLSAICREIFARVSMLENRRNPVRLYVDEFSHFAANQEFQTILSEGRRFRFSLVLAHQSLVQLPHDLRSLVLNNVGTKIVLRTGREDGRVLSQDLTGDPKRLNLTDLPVGEAYIWRKARPLVHAEINRPIVRGSAGQSAAVKRLLSHIPRGESAPPHINKEPQNEIQSIDGPRTKQRRHSNVRLEDWL